MTSASGNKSRRARTGCFTCRQRHYKCDETHPLCNRCKRSGLVCRWPHASSSTVLHQYDHRSRQGNEVYVLPSGSLLPIGLPLTTREVDMISFYLSEFHSYSYQMCAWTALIALPRRSTIPSILQLERPNERKLTNWANYFLPHLATGLANDPLSLSISAFTSLRMDSFQVAAAFYSATLYILRQTLKEKDAASMGNQDFLRVWATTLLLAEYEAQMGNQAFQSQHVEGATTLSFIAASRFALKPVMSRDIYNDLEPSPDTAGVLSRTIGLSSPETTLASSCTSSTYSVTSPDSASSPEAATAKMLPRNERELPAYLAQLTQRLRHSSTINESLDQEWPVFEHPPMERNALGGLLEKSAECYAHVMPLIEEFYTMLSIASPRTSESYHAFVMSFDSRVIAAKRSIAEYRNLLDQVPLSDNDIYKSCAEDSLFPFSPIIRFANPLMCQPMTIPHIFLMFMAPFITQQEHESCIRYISGVFAGFEYSKGLKLTSAFPDLYVAAFWRRGVERDYFAPETRRRAGAFMLVLNRIWGTIDHLQISRGGIELGRVEILGIALKEYRDAQMRGLRLQHTRH